MLNWILLQNTTFIKHLKNIKISQIFYLTLVRTFSFLNGEVRNWKCGAFPSKRRKLLCLVKMTLNGSKRAFSEVGSCEWHKIVFWNRAFWHIAVL